MSSRVPMPAGSVLRMLDANANRAREALRVLEDYARFVLNHGELSGGLKGIRHGLAEALKGVLDEAILRRDTPGDVGTDNKTASEGRRAGLEEVVIAAGKRLGEALRVIEEALKVQGGPAEAVERLRYRFYDLEQQVARTLGRGGRFGQVRLYVLITEALCRCPWLETAEQAILGGADCLQLREKQLDGGELLERARRLVELCRRHGVLCIINDRPDVALLSGADGVHVGQEDLPAAEVRRLVGRERIVGVSTQRIEQARQAVVDGADYIGVGPVFRSRTKVREILPGLAYAREVAGAIPIPAVAIAGITLENVDEVVAAGIGAVAVTAAVTGSADPQAAARRLKERIVKIEPHPVGQTFLSARDEVAIPAAQVHKSRRRLPYWQLAGSTYFVTFRVAAGELSPDERTMVLKHIRSGHGRFYGLIAAVVMPDHVHMLIRPEQVSLGRIMKGIKGVTSRLVNEARATGGRLWQDESWDRIVRDQKELDEKLEYMLNNAVERGLVNDPWEYEWWLVNREGGETSV